MLSSKATATARSEPRRVLPDGCIDTLFELSPRPVARYVGTMTRALVVAQTPEVDIVAVRFRPGGVRPFLEGPAHELTDRTIDLAWPNAEEILERLASATPAIRPAILDRVLRAALPRSRTVDPLVTACIERLRDPRAKVQQLERFTGLSQRQLERRFKHEIGISPKRFARIMRFRRVLDLAPRLLRGDWAEAALDLGYSDQAHLIHEVKALSGLTPRAAQLSYRAAWTSIPPAS